MLWKDTKTLTGPQKDPGPPQEITTKFTKCDTERAEDGLGKGSAGAPKGMQFQKTNVRS